MGLKLIYRNKARSNLPMSILRSSSLSFESWHDYRTLNRIVFNYMLYKKVFSLSEKNYSKSNLMGIKFKSIKALMGTSNETINVKESR